MCCQFQYVIKKNADKHIDVAKDETITSSSWEELDTRLFQGKSRIIIGDVHFEEEEVYLLNFSANWILALRGLAFYASNEEKVHIEESSGFLRLRIIDGVVEVESFIKEDLSENKRTCIDLMVLLREAGSAHKELLDELFRRIPRILENRNFMDGYPDARRVSRLSGIDAVADRGSGRIVIKLEP